MIIKNYTYKNTYIIQYFPVLSYKISQKKRQICITLKKKLFQHSYLVLSIQMLHLLLLLYYTLLSIYANSCYILHIVKYFFLCFISYQAWSSSLILQGWRRGKTIRYQTLDLIIGCYHQTTYTLLHSTLQMRKKITVFWLLQSAVISL